MKIAKSTFFVFSISIVLFSSFKLIATPKISIITSVYNGDQFIEGFMRDITRQTIFDQCELILINANSPGNEERIIKRYLQRYPNIIYVKLDHDPGLYGVWNITIKMAHGIYLTNANIDDRLAPRCYEKHAKTLDEHPEIDLVYSDYLLTVRPNETFEKNTAVRTSHIPQFSPKCMNICLPNNHPMWRATFHEKYGFFNESYKIAGDYEMWLRAVKQGAQFLKVPEVLALFYKNPQGLSNHRFAFVERLKIQKLYKEVYS